MIFWDDEVDETPSFDWIRLLLDMIDFTTRLPRIKLIKRTNFVNLPATISVNRIVYINSHNNYTKTVSE